MKLYILRNAVSILALIISLHIVSFSKIKLPIEVLGQEGKVVTRKFSLNQSKLNKAKLVWMQVNNLSYQNKASVKINNGAWLPLNHTTVSMHAPEKARGGMVHGGFNTIRFTIPATNLKTGENTIYFRFNQSDGISIGYRVVNLNLFDVSRKSLLPNSEFTRDNPNNWRGPYTDATRINQGRDLWYNANLRTNYLPAGRSGKWYAATLPANVPMRAKCTNCHTQDGRDLEIFSYSNEAIIERSKFHNLTTEQGKKIASYIRSLSGKIRKVGRYGRPWNPPYQPGPSLKNVPIERWAAGAGLNAVLQNDKDMLPHMFPNGVNQGELYKYFDSNKRVDRTILPLAIQFPDWKHWLPIIHPMDAYTKNNYWNKTNLRHSPKKAYSDLRDYLSEQAPSTRNKEDLFRRVNRQSHAYRHYLTEGSADPNHWRTRDGNATKSLGNGVSRELAATSLARLNGVQFFELMNEFNLEDKAHWFVKPGDKPPKRQWVGSGNQVFTVPAHFNACVDNNCRQFKGQPTETGLYETTSWYHLQLIVNGGDGLTRFGTPVDYNYHPPFILEASKSSGVAEPLRFYHAMSQVYQIRTWSGGNSNDNTGFRIRNQGPWMFLGLMDNNATHYSEREFPLLLDKIVPGLTKWTLNAQVRQFLREMAKSKNSLNNWTRTEEGTSTALDRKTKTEADLLDPSNNLFQSRYADKMYYAVKVFNKLGLDRQIMRDLVGWCNRAWPNINWNQFIQEEYVQMRKENALGFSIDGNWGGVENRQLALQGYNENNINQKWVEIPRGNGYFSYQKAETNFCMDGKNGGVNGQKVILSKCRADNHNQHWKKIKLGANTHRLQKRNAPNFSVDGGGGGSNGQGLKLWSNNNANKNQQWRFNGGRPAKMYHLRKESNANFALDGGGGSVVGAKLKLWSQNKNSVNQNWLELPLSNGYYAYQKSGTNLCMHGPPSSTSNDNVTLRACDVSDLNQHWSKIKSRTNTYRLEKRNDQYMTIDGLGSGGSNGHPVRLTYGGRFNKNKHWFFDEVLISPVYQMRKVNALAYAIDGGSGGVNNRRIHLWRENRYNANQQWVEEPKGGGFYAYRKENTNFCLDGGNGGSNGQAVVLYTCNNNQNQHWKKINLGTNIYRLQKRNAPNFSIDGGGGGTNGQKLKLWTNSNSNKNQQWLFNRGVGNSVTRQYQEDIALETNSTTANVSLYPNIASDQINIEGLPTGSYEMMVYDQSGNQFENMQLNHEGLTTISVDGLSDGIYFLSIIGDDSSQVLKFIKRNTTF